MVVKPAVLDRMDEALIQTLPAVLVLVGMRLAIRVDLVDLTGVATAWLLAYDLVMGATTAVVAVFVMLALVRFWLADFVHWFEQSSP